ncbi:MAG TPA: DUF4157 domain-containing protein [Gemmatimonadaceae bacterium]|nr:DUF4157 domain-containing protein [Gemmatimonadaceae bacterium]
MSAATTTRAATPAALGARRGNATAERAQPSPASLSGDALQLQRSAGNTAVRGLVQRMCAGCAQGGAKCDHCHEEEPQVARMQRATSAPGEVAAPAAPAAAPQASGGAAPVPTSVRAALSQAGAPLPSDARATMESGFRQSFADVRLHTGAAAAQSAADVGALAYTVGAHIVFGAGRFAPGTARGSHLLAHELTHVVQQRHATIDLDRLSLDKGPTSAPEREAEAMATRVAAGDTAALFPGNGENVVQRKMIETEAAGGCGLCKGPDRAGSIVHTILQMEFKLGFDLRMMAPSVTTKTYNGPTGFVELPLQPAPGDEDGRLDLAVIDDNGDIHIGEIKPANSAALQLGKEDITWYSDQIRKRYKKSPIPLQIPIDTTYLVFPNEEAPDCEIPQMIHVNPPTADGVYTYYCSPTRDELFRNPDCRCWPKKRRKKKEERKKKPVEKPVQKPEHKPIGKPIQPPVIIDGPTEVPQPQAPAQPDVPQESPGEGQPADPAKAPETGGKEIEGEGNKGTGEGEGNKSTGEGEGEGGGKIIQFPGKRGNRIPAPSSEDIAAAARIAVVAAIVAIAVKFGGKRVLAPLTVVATLILVANGAEAKISLTGDDPLEVLLKTGGKKGIKLSPELEKAIRNDPKLMDTLQRAAATGDLSAAQKELSTQLTQTIVANRDKFTDAELEELVKVTDPKNGALPAGNASVEEIKKLIAAHKAGARPTGGGGGGTGPGTGKKSESSHAPVVSPPGSKPVPPASGGGTVPGAPGAAQGQKGESGVAPPPVSATKEGEKGTGGGGTSTTGDTTGAKGPAVSLPAATTPATRLLNVWAQSGGAGPKLTEQSKKAFLDWAASVSPPLTDAEVAELAPRLVSNQDKTIDQMLKSIQDGLVELRAKKLPPSGAIPGEEGPTGASETKSPPSDKTTAGPKTGGGAQAKSPGSTKKPIAGKDATKAAPQVGSTAAQKPKQMSEDEKKVGEQVAAFLRNVKLAEGHVQWMLDDATKLEADPTGAHAVAAWMYGRLNGRLFAAHVTLHPTSHVGNVWSFHIDSGASIFDASGRIVSTSNAVDTKGILSGE